MGPGEPPNNRLSLDPWQHTATNSSDRHHLPVRQVWARYLQCRPVWVSDDVGDDPLEFDCLEETRLVRLGRARRTVWGLLRRSVG